MGHLGFTPQSVNTLGGFRVQGAGLVIRTRMVEEARRVENAGAFSLVLELVPAAVAKASRQCSHPDRLGISAGRTATARVLVLHDLLGLNDQFKPKFLRRYAELRGRCALRRWVASPRTSVAVDIRTPTTVSDS